MERQTEGFGNHAGPDLTVRVGVKDRIAKTAILAISFGLLGPFRTMIYWEVLNGVGVDGVGVIFPFFYAFFPCFYAFFPFFYAFVPFFLLKDKGKQQQFTAKMGNFTPTPSAPTPCKTSRFLMPEIKQKQPQDRKTILETLSLPVAKVLSPLARQAPTKDFLGDPLRDPKPLRTSQA